MGLSCCGPIISPYSALTLDATIVHVNTPSQMMNKFTLNSTLVIDEDSVSKTAYNNGTSKQDKS
jgi:hypothetical protein